MAQDLVGCEVAAELGDLRSIFGIVTNFKGWIFLRSLDERIDEDTCLLGKNVDDTGPILNDLAKITGKIYAMLSDD